jgi:hypothetical protein
LVRALELQGTTAAHFFGPGTGRHILVVVVVVIVVVVVVVACCSHQIAIKLYTAILRDIPHRLTELDH